MQSDDAETSISDALIAAMNDLRQGQRAILHLADFMVEREVEIDGRRAAVLRRARVEFPDVDPDAVLKVLDAFDGLGERLDSDEEAAQEVQDSLSDIIRQLPADYQTQDFLDSVTRAQGEQASLPVLLASLLVQLVGGLEELVSNVARLLYGRYPGTLNQSERAFSWREIAEHDNLDAFRETVIDRAVSDLMRESSEGWMKHFATRHGIDIPAIASATETKEVLQRRHILVHNGGRVSRLYLTNLQGMEPKPSLGDRLEVDRAYLARAADCLAATGLGLVGAIGRAVIPHDERHGFESYLTNLPYRMLQDSRFAVTLELSSTFPPESFTDEYMGLVVRVNRWLALKRLGRFDECREEVTDWQTAPLLEVFRLAQLALLDEVDAALALVRKIRGSTELTTSFWLTWPLLAEVREYERQRLIDERNSTAE